jgi:predicted adenylyl cyclase CyaB
MPQYEVELKSLLETLEKTEELKKKLQEIDPQTKLRGKNKQLNHYFEGGEAAALKEHLLEHLHEDHHDTFHRVVDEGKNHSIRTRQLDDKTLLVLKAAVDDTTSENGISRMEFEAETPHLSLEELDALLHKAGYGYQAKWSREREEYDCNGCNVCIDKNAGYGYVAELEKVVEREEEIEAAREELRAMLAQLELEELPQDRLGRMFAHYNENWRDYYGTDKTFTIE